MEEHVKIRLEYVRLVRAGKLKEAQKILEKIWDRKELTITKKPIKAVDKPIIEESKEETLDDLVLIKGIGKKTIVDIKVMFKDLKSLKKALKKNRVPLRDDIVEKLREELI